MIVDTNWDEDIPNFAKNTIWMYEFLKVVEEVRSRALKRKVRINSAKLIEEDRKKR